MNAAYNESIPSESADAASTPPLRDFRRNSFTVQSEEAGQKLFQCLLRRLRDTDEPSVHRWIRTGQVRVNGKRKKAFDRLEAGDEIRLPPFAEQRITAHAAPAPTNNQHTLTLDAALGLEIIAETNDILALHKPVGLPVHPGTGHTDSVTTRLAAHYASAPFVPAPAHRLDRDTSGVLLVGLSYERVRGLTEAFAGRTVCKEYLCWCAGCWPHAQPVTLTDTLAKTSETSNAAPSSKNRERVTRTTDGKEASLTVTPLRVGNHASLLHIELHTGRTHQIRAQLALRGHPVAGDGKYGGRTAMLTGAPHLLLHAFRIALHLPDLPDLAVAFTAQPPWGGPWFCEA